MRQERGGRTTLATSGVDLRRRTKQRGTKEKARRKCDMRFSFNRRNRVFQRNCIRIGVRKLLKDGLGPCESVVTASRGQCAYRKIAIAEADGGSRQEGVCVFVCLSSRRSKIWRPRRTYSPWPRSFGRKVSGWKNGEESGRRRGGSTSLKVRHGDI